jgi:hypothetical protein
METDMISTHPSDATYFASRANARENCKRGQRVIGLGQFAGGSFGVYPRQKSNGLYVGQLVGPGGSGPIPMVHVWMVTSK